jgi:predicted Zn-ribbon and HTH transcriptional regulator
MIREVTLDEWLQMDMQEGKQLQEWERSRVIGRCKSCGQPYSFERGMKDPKECQHCRGEEGDFRP